MDTSSQSSPALVRKAGIDVHVATQMRQGLLPLEAIIRPGQARLTRFGHAPDRDLLLIHHPLHHFDSTLLYRAPWSAPSHLFGLTAMSSSRTSTPSTSSPRNPLESLVTSLVPSLAPPRDSSSRSISRAGHRPESAVQPSPEAERRRREKVKALVESYEGILARCVQCMWSMRARG